jgi:hypothetical protein
LVAKLLRQPALELSPVSQTQTLQNLIQQAHDMPNTAEEAKALCELGYTAGQIQQADLSQTLLAEGAEIAKKIDPYVFTDAKGALGACVFWLQVAGDHKRANDLLETLHNRMPKGYENLGANAVGSLIEIATDYAEAEKGEVDWLDNLRLTP